MAPRSPFAQALVTLATVSEEQLQEALSLIPEPGDLSLIETLVRLGYADPGTLVRILAVIHGLPFVDLDDLRGHHGLVEQIPESIARENLVFPLELAGSTLSVAVANPNDPESLDKLRFILNLEIRPVLAEGQKIREAIDFWYGQTETESVDSMLSEFTETAVRAQMSHIARHDDSTPTPDPEPPPPVQRRANVRYYDRMNPARLFPLLVVLSAGQLTEIRKRHVSQKSSGAFGVELDSLVVVEPVLPGCHCYPPRELVRIRPGDVTATFWVAPHVSGEVSGARVLVRQEGKYLAVVPLDMRIRQKTASILLGLSSLLLPAVMVILKHFNLDFESQMDEGFPLFASVMNWTLSTVRPEVLGAILLGLAAVAYLATRPRKRDVFWDIRTEPDEK